MKRQLIILRERTVRTMTTIEKYARKTSIERLSEIYKEWLEAKRKAANEPITAQELAEFFVYINNELWDKW